MAKRFQVILTDPWCSVQYLHSYPFHAWKRHICKTGPGYMSEYFTLSHGTPADNNSSWIASHSKRSEVQTAPWFYWELFEWDGGGHTARLARTFGYVISSPSLSLNLSVPSDKFRSRWRFSWKLARTLPVDATATLWREILWGEWHPCFASLGFWSSKNEVFINAVIL
jgi:hypothetical protein